MSDTRPRRATLACSCASCEGLPKRREHILSTGEDAGRLPGLGFTGARLLACHETGLGAQGAPWALHLPVRCWCLQRHTVRRGPGCGHDNRIIGVISPSCEPAGRANARRRSCGRAFFLKPLCPQPPLCSSLQTAATHPPACAEKARCSCSPTVHFSNCLILPICIVNMVTIFLRGYAVAEPLKKPMFD